MTGTVGNCPFDTAPAVTQRPWCLVWVGPLLTWRREPSAPPSTTEESPILLRIQPGSALLSRTPGWLGAVEAASGVSRWALMVLSRSLAREA